MEVEGASVGRIWPWLLLTMLGSLVAAWPIATLLVGSPLSQPPPRLMLVPAGEDLALYTVPPFEHLNERGERFGSADLVGSPWIASFFFTSCPSICPELTRVLTGVQARLETVASSARIVSFTVDPVTDTPETLAGYAKTAGAKPGRWTFVTGEPSALYRTIVDGFKQPMGEGEPGETPGREDNDVALDIAHGVRFALVDAQLGIRGLYDANEAGVDALLADLRLLEVGAGPGTGKRSAQRGEAERSPTKENQR